VGRAEAEARFRACAAWLEAALPSLAWLRPLSREVGTYIERGCAYPI
jgi:hypothetical protein